MSRTGEINAKVIATKPRWNFSLQTHPIHTKGPKTHVLLHFVMFGCILDRFVTALNSVQNGPNCWELLHLGTVAINAKVHARSRVGTFR